MIEKRRHQNIDKKHRNHIEDEMYFLLECECYATHRKDLYDTINGHVHK